MSLWTISLIAFGGCLAIEGVGWAIFPRQMREMYREAFVLGDKVLHQAGLFSVALGVGLIVLAVKSVS